MPTKRFKPVAEVAEMVEPTADLDELPAAPVDHSTNGLLAVDDAVPDLPPVEWASEIAKQESRRDLARDALAQIERKMGKARLQRALGKPQAFDALTEVHRLATEEVIDAESNIRTMQGELFNAETRVETARLQREHDETVSLVHEGMKDAVLFDDLIRQIGVVCERMEPRNRRLSGRANITGIHSNRLNLSSKFAAAIFASAPSLARFLELPRLKPFSQHEPLALAEQRTWARFCGTVRMPTVDEAKSDAPPAADPSNVGQYGAVARDQITTGGETYSASDLIPPEVVTAWPMKNRVALVSLGRIEFLPAPKQDSEPDA